MKRKQTPVETFEKLAENYLNGYVTEYKKKVKKAKEGFQAKAHYAYKDNIERKEHIKIQNDLGSNGHFFFEIQDELEDDNDKEFASVFNEKFQSVSSVNKKKLLEDLARLESLNRLIKFLSQDGIKYRNVQVDEYTKSEIDKLISTIKWNGNIELEFVQLIYSLHEAGYLTNKENQITTLVKQVAKAFNYELNDHWQSNLSDSVNNRNTDYQPKIFEKIIKGFATYRDKQIEINKKKKPK